ncbi:MAG: heavy metal translocating P-type ATPase [Thermomicrobiales bacterium]
MAGREMGKALPGTEVLTARHHPSFADGTVLSPPAALTPPVVPESVPGRLAAWWEQWGLAVGAVLCWAFLALALIVPRLVPVGPQIVLALYVASYIAGGTTAAINALRLLVTERSISIDLLMITAAAGAAYLGSWEEGAILLGLFSTSGALEHYALGRTERAVKALMDLSPAVATVIVNGLERVTPVEQLQLGDTVLVRPGERVSVDGTVLSGETSVDQAAITGESVPVPKSAGAAVFAGTINGSGAIYVRVDRLHQESTLAKIVQFVAQAQAQKSATQRFTDRFEGAYAIGVILFAILVGAIPIFFLHENVDAAVYRAITLLVVASPCALVISTPAATLSALANAARNGVLFKGSADLENIGETRIVAFDKTGTLTHGKPALTNVEPLGTWDAQTLLQLAASAEHFSEHHMARAMVDGAAERQIPLLEADNFRSFPGKGVTAQVAGQEVMVGNAAHFAGAGVVVPAAAERVADEMRDAGCTAVFAGNRLGIQGVLGVADTLRPDAVMAIRELKELGISRIVVLTGDHQRLADAICTELGVDEVRGDMLPEEKLRFIEALEQQGRVAMVGDGVNDAPALAIASVGVAMGGAGTDVALETADVVLMGDDLRKLPYAIELSRRTRRTIRQNLAFALLVIAVLVTATLTHGIPLPLGVVGHEGSTIIVVLLGLRLLIWKRDTRHPVTAA